MKVMLRTYMPAAAVLLAASLLGSGSSSGQEISGPETAALRKTAEAYVAAFNKREPAKLAALFTENGEIINQDDGTLVRGRAAIQRRYEEWFAGEDVPTVALEAASVRFVSPGLAIEDGILHATDAAGLVESTAYSAVQVRQEDGSWLTASVRDRQLGQATAEEELLSLEWMIGEWEIQVDGSTTLLAFNWSDDGPYIDGEALTQKSGIESTSSTYRIGWNAARGSFVSWGFDALGGYSQSAWTLSADGDWLLRSKGVTADGEENLCNQTIHLDASGEHFTWTKRDQTIGGEAQVERSLSVVKRPPELKSADSK